MDRDPIPQGTSPRPASAGTRPRRSPGLGAGLFLLTGLGGLFFCWLYQRWEYSLWAPFSLHLSMNLAWQVFAVGDSALAGWLPTALQLTTTVVAALLAIYRERIPLLRA